MSVNALNWAYEQRTKPNAKAVLVALAHRHHAKTGRCNPSVETLSLMTCLSPRAVQYALRDLEEGGFIRAKGSRKGGRAKSINYTFRSPAMISKGRTTCTLNPPERVQETAGFSNLRKGAPHAPDREEITTKGGTEDQRPFLRVVGGGNV